MSTKNRIVLCYHRVSPHQSGGKSLLSVTNTNFQKQLNILKRFFNLVSLEKFVSDEKSNDLAITFDDGYSDNLAHALPILEKLNIESTFFVSTMYIQKNYLYLPDLLDIAFASPSNIDALFSELETIFPGTEFPEEYWGMLDKLVSLDYSNFEKVLDLLTSKFGKQVTQTDEHRRPMSPSELSELASSKIVSVGAHTVTHRRLSSLSDHDCENEISGSIEVLRTLYPDKFTKFFAYPFGQPTDFNSEVEKYLHDLGFQTLSTDPVGVRQITSGIAIPRLCVQDWKPVKLLVIVQLCIFAAKFPIIWKNLRRIRRYFI